MSRHRLSLLARLAATAFCVLVTIATVPDKTHGAEGLTAGAVAVDITPDPIAVSLNGGMADRTATAVADPIHVRCLALGNGNSRVVFAIIDSCVTARDLIDAAKQKAAAVTGIPVSHMLISSTHAHSCPTNTSAFQSVRDEKYAAFLVDKVAEGIAKADRARVPAKIGWTTADVPSQVFHRRWKAKEGEVFEDPFGRKRDKVRMNPGFNNGSVTEPAGPVDPQVIAVSVQTLDGAPISVLANYSLHYVGDVPGNNISADYFGVFATRVGRLAGATATSNPGFVGIMTNGTSGNINNVDYSLKVGPKWNPGERSAMVTESILEGLAKRWSLMDYFTSPIISAAETEIELKVRKPDAEELQYAEKILKDQPAGTLKGTAAIYARETTLLAKYPATVKAKIQAIRIGSLGIVSSPCETFVETGLAIKRGSPFPVTFTIELANGYNGYLPTRENHELGGYETWRAQSSYVAEDSEEIVRAAQLKMLEEVAKGK